MIDKHRSDVDDGAAANLLEVGYYRLGQEEGALEVDAQEPVEIGLVDVEEGPWLEDAGVIDENVDAPEMG